MLAGWRPGELMLYHHVYLSGYMKIVIDWIGVSVHNLRDLLTIFFNVDTRKPASIIM